MTHSPELEALLKAAREVYDLTQRNTIQHDALKSAIAKFDPPAPPVEYDYVLPEWEEFRAKHPNAGKDYALCYGDIQSFLVSPGLYNTIRKATKTPRKPAPKLGREWWLWPGIRGMDAYEMPPATMDCDIKVIHVREVLEETPTKEG